MNHEMTVPPEALPLIASAMGVSGVIAFEVGALGNDPFVSEASLTILDDGGRAIVVCDLNAQQGPSSFDATVQLARDTIADLGGTLVLDNDDIQNPATIDIAWS